MLGGVRMLAVKGGSDEAIRCFRQSIHVVVTIIPAGVANIPLAGVDRRGREGERERERREIEDGRWERGGG
jgi:hypothetical protein